MRRAATLGAVLVALAVLYVAAWRTLPQARSTPAPGPTSMAGSTALVTSVTRTCPPPAPNTGEAHIAVIAQPGHATAPAGAAQLSAIPFAPSAPPTASPSGKTARENVRQDSAVVWQDSAVGRQDGRKLRWWHGRLRARHRRHGHCLYPRPANGPGCPVRHPVRRHRNIRYRRHGPGLRSRGSDSVWHGDGQLHPRWRRHWFIGAGTAAGAPVTRLYLMNPGTVAASAEVTILTDAGIQQGLNTAIPVAPGHYIWENVTKYTAGSVVLGVPTCRRLRAGRRRRVARPVKRVRRRLATSGVGPGDAGRHTRPDHGQQRGPAVRGRPRVG